MILRLKILHYLRFLSKQFATNLFGSTLTCLEEQWDNIRKWEIVFIKTNLIFQVVIDSANTFIMCSEVGDVLEMKFKGHNLILNSSHSHKKGQWYSVSAIKNVAEIKIIKKHRYMSFSPPSKESHL